MYHVGSDYKIVTRLEIKVQEHMKKSKGQNIKGKNTQGHSYKV